MSTNSIAVETQTSGSVGRSIWAVLAGFLAVFILSLGTDEILHLTRVYPPWGQTMSDSLFGLATFYRTIYGVLGSCITARLAPRRPMKHAFIGAAIGMVLATAGAAATWNHEPPLGPHWYSVVLIVEAPATAWLGAWLYLRSRTYEN